MSACGALGKVNRGACLAHNPSKGGEGICHVAGLKRGQTVRRGSLVKKMVLNKREGVPGRGSALRKGKREQAVAGYCLQERKIERENRAALGSTSQEGEKNSSRKWKPGLG